MGSSNSLYFGMKTGNNRENRDNRDDECNSMLENYIQKHEK